VVRNVLTQFTRRTPAAFPLQGEDWFALNGPDELAWPEITALLRSYQDELAAAAQAGELQSADTDPFDVVLGVTCHAIYHAGQIQLVKKFL
jgi:hypothetical protein